MKIFIISCLFSIVCLYSCIDPYKVNEGGEGKLLIIDGLITNAEGPYYISLNYSSPNFSSLNNKVANANVKVIDDSGFEWQLEYVDNGRYKTPLDFRGIIGRSYKLMIENNSRLYESNFCLLREPSCIEGVSFRKNSKISNNQTKEVLEFVVDARVCSETESYLRWDVKEDWKINLRMPEYFYMTNDTTFESFEEVNNECFKQGKLERIVVHSFQNQIDKSISGKAVASISASSSDRFLNRYRATINQYSISREEYSFWNKLKESSEEQGDFFGKQPYSVYGNVKCISDPSENVLGYFQVAGIVTEEMYITRGDINKFNFVPFSYPTCTLDTINVSDDYSLYERYLGVKQGGNWGFYTPYFTMDNDADLLGIVFTSAECAYCGANGAQSDPPKGWYE